MYRLVPMDPTFVYINKSLLTETGIARFGEMKSLTGLATLHIFKPTPEAKAALTKHSAIESFFQMARSQLKFGPHRFPKQHTPSLEVFGFRFKATAKCLE